MKFKNVAIICSLVLVVGVFIFTTMQSDAKQVDFQIETVDETVEKGKDVTVSLTVKGDVTMSSIEAYIVYDDAVLEFQSASEQTISGASGTLRLAQSFEEGVTEAEYAITFRALEVGTSSFKVQEMYVEEEENSEVVVMDNSTAQVKVIRNNEESKDASLESLEVFPETLTPEFTKSNVSYSMTVDSDTSDIVISAISADSDSAVTISGNEDFKVGENEVVITVTSLSGVSKEYKIIVNKQSN